MSLVTRDILVWRERNDSLPNLKSRIEYLFGVDIRLPSSYHQRPATTTTRVVSRGGGGGSIIGEEDNKGTSSSSGNEWIKVSGSEDACYKTQQYVLATYRPDVSTVVPCGIQFANLLFKGSPRLRDGIEKDHQTLLLPAPNGILVQGSHSSVKATVSKLHQLMETTLHHDYSSTGPYTVWDRTSGTHPAGPNRTACPPHSSFPSSHVSSTSHDRLDQQLSQLIKDPQSDIPDSLKKVLLEKLQNSPSKTSATKSTDDSFLTSPPVHKLSQRVKQFVELGYPQDKVEMVVGSLGTDATDNDIMARLVAIHRPTANNSGSTNTTSTNTSNPSIPTNIPSQPMPVSQQSTSVHREGLRPIVIDGSNIAMSHGKGAHFSCRGIGIAVNWFRQRGHSEITVFVPSWRKEPSKPETPITEQEILFDLAKSSLVHYTPSRRVRDKKIVCYDDRFIVKLAAERGGVIVSNDHFRDLLSEKNPLWTEAIENRLLMYTFVDDTFMVPADPLGKHGPHLDGFLRFESGRGPYSSEGSSSEYQAPRDKQPCPYKERCNFGPRCRYYHPERETNKLTTEESLGTKSPSLNNEKVDYTSIPSHGGGSPSKLHQFIDGRGNERQMVYCGGSLEHRDTFSPPNFSPLPHSRPDVSQWAPTNTRMPPMKVIPRGTGDIAYPPPTSKPHPPPPQFASQRILRPEYYPANHQYYQTNEHFIDHTHHHVRHHGIETAPLPRRVPPPTGPSRPHSAQHMGGTYYYETPSHAHPHPHHHQYTHDHAHTQSVFDRALQIFPNEREKIQTLLYQYPNIDLQNLIQYFKR